MAEEYRRSETGGYSIPQNFADKDIGKCPFCKNEDKKWLVKEEWKLLGNNYYFKCSACESELMVTKDDVTGLSFTKASPSGKKKMRQNKIMNVPYVTVVKIGLEVKTPENMLLQGEEMPLPKLKKMCEEME